MNIQIFDVEQGSESWFACRAGIPTCSNFDKVQMKGRGGVGESKTRADYICQLADEAIYHDAAVEPYTNENLERGKAWEADARSNYALRRDVMPQQVGFIRNNDFKCGGSPDALIGQDGMLEIKTSFPKLWVPWVLKDEFPNVHQAQCQGLLWISGRTWIDLMVYWPHRKPWIKRAYRDEPYLAELAKAVAAFNVELAATTAALRTKYDLMGTLQAAAEEKYDYAADDMAFDAAREGLMRK